MFKVKFLDIINAKSSLDKIASIPINLELSYHLSLLLKALNEKTHEFENKRLEILKSLGTEREDGTYEIPDEHKDEVKTKINSILNEDTHLEAEIVDISGVSKSVNLTIFETIHLNQFITCKQG